MDYRFSCEEIIGAKTFGLANAGASLNESPRKRKTIDKAVASMLLSLEVAKEQNRVLAVTQASHSDCRDVKNIYESAERGKRLRHRYQITLFRPYRSIAQLVIDQGLTKQQSLDLLSAAKAIQDINHLLSYHEIRDSIKDTTSVHFLEHYDISTKPRRLMAFNPATQMYEEPAIGNGERRRTINVGPRTVDIVRDPALLLTYQITQPIDVQKFIKSEAARIRNGTSIILSQVQPTIEQAPSAPDVGLDQAAGSKPSINLPYARASITTKKPLKRDKKGRFKRRRENSPGSTL